MDRTILVNGKRWRLRYVPMRTADGECDPPTQAAKEIRIARRLKTSRHARPLAETLIHELLHATLWDIDEGKVDQVASDIARILDQEGCLVRHA